eukprot:CAMPEP_0174385176 /NCGR_PEP_ID=MMETSP0811_2-20130205/126423_1 /TAXON_ID=73025 ORGANISM="Eutreptiella gymnastica-like, Strain CCMP1594" /NCGR_SAMPLE_ID=MMETSP0811_2 /ASSEMBLY_ACC=CAM_ASM_000667 /LENGTH=144 /DNA_ID=CAMNT_0015539403 /DNA_START=36 /DNA_END=470 /DNA_ORIENTATION=+
MPLYEMVYILSTKVPRAQQSAVMSGIARDILAQGGVIRQLSNEGICQMQYTMRRFGVAHRRGRFVSMLFDASPLTVFMAEQKMARKIGEVFRWRIFRRDQGSYRNQLGNPLDQDTPMDLTRDLEEIERKQQEILEKDGNLDPKQ